MSKCNTCIHREACAAWIRHGETLYDDFKYSVEECPHYQPRCKDCVHGDLCTNWRGKEYWGCAWFPYEIHEVDEDYFCGHGERKTR